LEAQGKGAKLAWLKLWLVSRATSRKSCQGREPQRRTAEKFAAELGSSAPMTQYFLMLVAHARAGTPGLKKHLAGELNRQRGQPWSEKPV